MFVGVFSVMLTVLVGVSREFYSLTLEAFLSGGLI